MIRRGIYLLGREYSTYRSAYSLSCTPSLYTVHSKSYPIHGPCHEIIYNFLSLLYLHTPASIIKCTPNFHTHLLSPPTAVYVVYQICSCLCDCMVPSFSFCSGIITTILFSTQEGPWLHYEPKSIPC